MPTDAPCSQGRNRCRAQRVKWSKHDVARVEALGDFFGYSGIFVAKFEAGMEEPLRECV